MLMAMSGRLENLLGALVVALSDSVSTEVTVAAGHPGAMGAALAILAQEPGLGIEQLRLPLGRTQSATVRVVDQLVAEGYAERRAGRDLRSVSVVLTDKGTATAARVLDSRHGVLRDAIAVLDADERQVLTAALEKVLAAITTDADQGDRICRLCDLAACPPRKCPVEIAGSVTPRAKARPKPQPIARRYRSHEHGPASSHRDH
jgi:MarR family transcriptional repressor of emrRAB